MDLSSVDTPTLQQWQQQALASIATWMSGAKPVSVNYSQGDGGRGVTFQAATLAEVQAWLARINSELVRRGAANCRRTRRAIGIRF